MNSLLEKQNLSNLTQENIGNLNKFITVKEIVSSKNHLSNKTSSPDGHTRSSNKCSRNRVLQSTSESWRTRNALQVIYKANITMLQKPNKDSLRKKHQRLLSHYKCGHKNSKQDMTKFNLKNVKKNTAWTTFKNVSIMKIYECILPQYFMKGKKNDQFILKNKKYLMKLNATAR